MYVCVHCLQSQGLGAKLGYNNNAPPLEHACISHFQTPLPATQTDPGTSYQLYSN